MKPDPTSLVETIAYIATMIGAVVAAVQGFLNRREIKPPTKARRRRLQDPEEKPTTLGERIAEVGKDVKAVKKQQADAWEAMARHMADPNAHANSRGPSGG